MIDIPIIPLITGVLTIGVRLTGILLFAPFFGSSVIPARVKAIFVIAMTFLLFPVIGKEVAPVSLASWPWLIFTEFLVGVGIGIATNIVFEAAQLAGQVLGVQMGYSLVNILDPQTQVDTPVVALFYQSIAMLLFLQMDVHYWVLYSVGNSYRYIPPGTAHIGDFFTWMVLKTVGQIFALGIQIAAPVLAATLAADIVLGLLGKASPQLPLMLLGPPLKSLLGIFLLAATLRYWPDMFRHLFVGAVKNTEHMFHLAS
jgi:flagellar biosynthesis protein FliR